MSAMMIPAMYAEDYKWPLENPGAVKGLVGSF